jgi:hypothetical protein
VGEKLYWSKPNQPEYWPSDYWIQVSSKGFRLRAGAFLDGTLYVASKEDIYEVQGTGASSFFAIPTGTNVGAISDLTFVPVKGHGIYHMASDGIYLFSQGRDVKFTGGVFDPIFAGTTVGSIPGMDWDLLGYSWMFVHKNQLWFGYGVSPGGPTTYYPKNFLVFDLNNGKTKHYSFSRYFNHATYQSVYDRFIAVDSYGIVYNMDDDTSTSDDGTDIDWQIQSKDFGNIRKYFPRWSKYDISIDGGGSATVSILLDDTVVQTHPIRTSRNTRKRLIATSTGDRLALRVAGSGPVEIMSLEVE